MNQTCDRCFQPTSATIMSMFNRQNICMVCMEKELQHPDYKKARAADEAAIKAGNFNFGGIGSPSDLNSKP